jgi:DNA polymerase-3 subunit delta'
MFDQLTGNNRVKEVLRRMLGSGRLPGALLFVGEEGVGKKLFALELARALNCRTPQGIEGCGSCSACKRIFEINYPTSSDRDDWIPMIWTNHRDVGMVVAPKRVLRVDQMRQIEREANFRPMEGNARFFIVDEAEKFNDASANALLKVLEEPPSTSHLILITSRPAMLLPTILSRCQMIRFAPLSPVEIERFLFVKTWRPDRVGLYYLCRIMDGEFRPSDEVSEFGYFSLDNLPDVRSQDVHLLKQLYAATGMSENERQLAVS